MPGRHRPAPPHASPVILLHGDRGNSQPYVLPQVFSFQSSRWRTVVSVCDPGSRVPCLNEANRSGDLWFQTLLAALALMTVAPTAAHYTCSKTLECGAQRKFVEQLSPAEMRARVHCEEAWEEVALFPLFQHGAFNKLRTPSVLCLVHLHGFRWLRLASSGKQRFYFQENLAYHQNPKAAFGLSWSHVSVLAIARTITSQANVV